MLDCRLGLSLGMIECGRRPNRMVALVKRLRWMDALVRCLRWMLVSSLADVGVAAELGLLLAGNMMCLTFGGVALYLAVEFVEVRHALVDVHDVDAFVLVADSAGH